VTTVLFQLEDGAQSADGTIPETSFGRKLSLIVKLVPIFLILRLASQLIAVNSALASLKKIHCRNKCDPQEEVSVQVRERERDQHILWRFPSILRSLQLPATRSHLSLEIAKSG